MKKDERQLLRLLETERMDAHFKVYAGSKRQRKWRQKHASLEHHLNQIMETLEPSQKAILNQYIEDLFEEMGRAEKMYCRSGVKDGLRLHHFVRKLK